MKSADAVSVDEKDIIKLKETISMAESKMRQDFLSSGVDVSFVVRVTPEVKIIDKELKSAIAASKGSAEASLTVISPISLDRNGKVKESFQVLVTQMGFEVGTKVQIGAGPSLQQGQVVQITETHIHLELHPKKKETKKDEEKEECQDNKIETLALDAKQMKKHHLQPLVPLKVDTTTKPVLEPDRRQPGMKWTTFGATEATAFCNAWLHVGMFHIHKHCSPTQTVIRKHVESDGLQFTMESDVAAKGLVIIPYALQYEHVPDGPPAAKRVKGKTSVSTCLDSVYIKYYIKGTNEADYVRARAPAAIDESTWIFWKLLSDEKYTQKGPSTLTWTTICMEVPLKANVNDSVSDKKGAIAKAGSQSILVLTFPALTNKDPLPSRSLLTIPSGDAPTCL